MFWPIFYFSGGAVLSKYYDSTDTGHSGGKGGGVRRH